MDQASPYTMKLKIFFSRTYELKRMAGSLPIPLEEDDVATTTCEEEVLNLNIPSTELSRAGKVLHTMHKILCRVWMLMSLQLTAEEWDIIMPYDILHQLWYEVSIWVYGLHFDLTLRMDRWLIINVSALQDCWYLAVPEDGQCNICMHMLSKRTMVHLRGYKRQLPHLPRQCARPSLLTPGAYALSGRL
jgi:hypothetical protein